MKPNTGNGRAGFTLIELLLAVTFGSVVMVMAVGLVHRGLVYHTATQSRVEQAGTLNRFAEQFRSDVHSAVTAKHVDGSLDLVSQRGESVKYSASGSRLTCERIIGTTRQVERVALAPDQTAEFTCSDNAMFCSLELKMTTQSGSSRKLRHIDAAVGVNGSRLQTALSLAEETP